MKILVTGCAGFIGYHTSAQLLDQGHQVEGIDNMSAYYDVTLKRARLKLLEGRSGWKFHHEDILHYENFEKIVRDGSFNGIIHLAAIPGVRYAMDHGIEYVRNNVEGTFNVFEIARHYRVPRIIYASSSAVYGANPVRPLSEDLNTDQPLSIYAATKKSCELIAYNYHFLYDVQSIGLRFFNTYGPWGRPDMALFLFTHAIAQGNPIDVFNHGDMKRDFIYVDDIVRGIIGSLNYSKSLDVFNLGSGEQVGLMDFIGLIERELGKKAIIHYKPMQPGEIKDTVCDTTKARTLLRHTATVSIDEGVNRFVAWYKQYYHL